MTARIVSVTFDDATTPLRSPEIAIERHKAVSDLLVDNSFDIKGSIGPYKIFIRLQDGRLAMDVTCLGSDHVREVLMPLAPLKSPIRDYGIICDNFLKTARAGEYHRLEAIDMGRRGLHNEAADLLIDSLEHKVILDKVTARRLFSLIYVLHMRNAPTL